MTEISSAGYYSPASADNLLRNMIQATASNMGRFTVRQDFMSEIGDYLYRGAPFWSRLPKEQAEADLIKEIRQTALPQAGFTSKQALETAPVQPAGNRNALDDPGQEVKAVSGFLDWSHYARSLAEQQGRPYGDQVSKDTNDMIASAAQSLEMGLFAGNAATNPLEFNGIARQLQPDHIITADITGATPDNIGQKLCEVVTRAMSSRRTTRRMSDIFASGSGWNLIQKEIEEKRLYTQTVEVMPGIQVPGILTPSGVLPISLTPYLDDTIGATANDPDIVHFYLIDINMLVWKGVYPLGGRETFDPQIFEVSSYVSNVPMTEKRMILCYGTLYAKNRGDAIWRLDVRCPRGTAWNYNN